MWKHTWPNKAESDSYYTVDIDVYFLKVQLQKALLHNCSLLNDLRVCVSFAVFVKLHTAIAETESHSYSVLFEQDLILFRGLT